MIHIYNIDTDISLVDKKVTVDRKQIYQFIKPKLENFVKELIVPTNAYDDIRDIKLNANLKVSFKIVVDENSDDHIAARMYDFKKNVPSKSQVLKQLYLFRDNVMEEMYIGGKFIGYLSMKNIKVSQPVKKVAKKGAKKGLSVNQLRQYLKAKGCKGYSKMNKKELTQYLKTCRKSMTVNELRAEARLLLPKCRGFSKLNKKDLIRYLDEHCRLTDLEEVAWMYE